MAGQLARAQPQHHRSHYQWGLRSSPPLPIPPKLPCRGSLLRPRWPPAPPNASTMCDDLAGPLASAHILRLPRQFTRTSSLHAWLAAPRSRQANSASERRERTVPATSASDQRKRTAQANGASEQRKRTSQANSASEQHERTVQATSASERCKRTAQASSACQLRKPAAQANSASEQCKRYYLTGAGVLRCAPSADAARRRGVNPVRRVHSTGAPKP